MRECEIKEYFSNGIAERISWATRKDAVGFNYQTKLGWFVDHLRGIHGCLLDVGCNVGNLAYLIREAEIQPAQLQVIGIDIVDEAIKRATHRNIPGT